MGSQIATYSLALLKLMDRSAKELPLGLAKRAGAESSTFNLPAHTLLKALITHAPSSATIAKEFLSELGKCGDPLVETLAEELYLGIYNAAADEWADIVYQKLQESTSDLSNITQLGSHYLSHLVIPFRNPGGQKTPQVSIHPTPNRRRIDEIEELLREAKRSSQSALKDLVMLRDGDFCLLTLVSFFPPNFVPARCAHLIPFSVHSKPQTLVAIEMFTGSVLDAQTIQDHLNHPRNAMNLERNAHELMDKYLAWGIEAISSGGQWKYYYRIVRPDRVSAFTRLKDGDEIGFGAGISGHRVPPPDPRICNLHLAVSRVSYDCGASEIFDQFLDDEDDAGFEVPVYFGGPFVSDNTLMRRLETLVF